MNEWRSMADATDETNYTAAPWDGRPVLIYTDHAWSSRIHVAVWTDVIHATGIYGWAVDDCKFGPYALRGFRRVTHWMPLPEPPKDEKK